ncbi:MAG: hypothetical protein QOG04_2151 [Actinomycetota bacterium]|jgi:hypothetical protein|nr:hypothetical protein [Actinomycetota bacterium]
MKVALFMALCNGPLVGVIALDFWGSGRSEARAEKALAQDRCQAGSRWLPGHRCGQHVVARLDVFEGYEYRFFRCLCEEHATEAQRRMAGPSYRVALLSPRDA